MVVGGGDIFVRGVGGGSAAVSSLFEHHTSLRTCQLSDCVCALLILALRAFLLSFCAVVFRFVSRFLFSSFLLSYFNSATLTTTVFTRLLPLRIRLSYKVIRFLCPFFFFFFFLFVGFPLNLPFFFKKKPYSPFNNLQM